MRHMIRSGMFVALMLVLSGSPALADIIFTTSGTTSGGAVSGTADFNIGASTLTLTLTNTTATIGAIAQVLDGLGFTLVGGSGLALSSVVATGFVDCTSTSCTSVSNFQVYGPGQTVTTLTSPYTWSLADTFLLAAGGGSYHPGGIVNGSITHTDGIPNAQHNDYLVGPVTFTFNFDTAPTDVTGATFYWGTHPETTSAVPEPSSLLLFGSALASLGAWGRKRWAGFRNV